MGDLDLAIEAFSKKDFPTAIESLKKIRSEGVFSVGVETYLGRALTENGQIAEGLLHLGNANYLARASKNTQQNLDYARLRVENGWGTQLSHPAEFFIKVDTLFRTEEMIFTSLILLFFFLAALFYKSGQHLKKTRFAFLFLSLGTLVVAFGSLAFSGTVAIANQKTDLREIPLLSEEAKATMPEGTRFRIIRVRADFLEIERPGQIRGWIEKKNATTVLN